MSTPASAMVEGLPRGFAHDQAGFEIFGVETAFYDADCVDAFSGRRAKVAQHCAKHRLLRASWRAFNGSLRHQPGVGWLANDP